MLAANPHAQAALAYAEQLGQPALLAQALGVMAMTDFLIGRGVDEEKLQRALELEDPTRRVSAQHQVRLIYGLILMLTGRLDEARQMFRALRRQLFERGEEAGLLLAYFYETWNECFAGSFQVAAGLARECSEIAAQLGEDAMWGFALTSQALVHAHLGRVEVARDEAQEAIAIFERTGWVCSRNFWPQWVLGFLELSLGNVGEAHAFLRVPTEFLQRAGLAEPMGAPCAVDEAESLVALGRLEEAESLAAWLDRQGQLLGRPWALATAARCRALICAARGDLDEALGKAEESLRLLQEHLPMPMELGRSLLVLGQVRRRRKEKRAASECLERALQIFTECEATLWMERVRGELSRVGLRHASHGSLTQTEQSVALVVARGLTNREAAAELFISPKSVEAHLARVYAKLGIRSRAELGSRMTTQGLQPSL